MEVREASSVVKGRKKGSYLEVASKMNNRKAIIIKNQEKKKEILI